MGCFISGKYAGRYDETAMIGYVQSDSTEVWRCKVRKSIEKGAKNLRLKQHQTNIQFIDVFPIEWISEHQRANLPRSIKIHHILLDCCVP